jgi:F0F1-type ATP synthase assembly protein I
MAMLITKFLVTSFIIVLVSEIAKRTDKVGALIASLPLVTIMVMIWLHVEKQGAEKIANHAYYTLWYVVPTLPMFAQIPYMLRKGFNFWLTMGVGIVVTFLCFLATVWVGRKFGVELMP